MMMSDIGLVVSHDPVAVNVTVAGTEIEIGVENGIGTAHAIMIIVAVEAAAVVIVPAVVEKGTGIITGTDTEG